MMDGGLFLFGDNTTDLRYPGHLLAGSLVFVGRDNSKLVFACNELFHHSNYPRYARTDSNKGLRRAVAAQRKKPACDKRTTVLYSTSISAL